MGFFDSIGSVLGSVEEALPAVVGDVASIVLAPETGGMSLAALAPSLIGAGSELLGGFSTNAAATANAAAANAASAAASDKQMAFQRDMRASQYQTTVEDLKKAGLNPMLAYSQGGAGTPSGSTYKAETPILHNPAKGLAQSASSAADVVLKHNQAKQLEIQNQLTQAQTLQTIAQTGKLDQDKATGVAVEAYNRALLGDVAASIELKALQGKAASAAAGLSQAQAEESRKRAAGETAQDPWYISNLKSSARDFFKNFKHSSNFEFIK